jgi:hypothetical protein
MEQFPIHRRVWFSVFFSRSRLVPRQFPILLAALSASFCVAVQGEPLKIVIAGDGRAEYRWNPRRCCDNGGMNETVTTAIAKAVSDEKASILLWTGDIVNVNDRNDGTLKGGLKKWRGIMAPLYAAGKKVWPVRGNHEVYRYPDPKNYDGELMRDSAAVWKETFPELPQNDPKSDDGLSFYSVEGSTLIIGLDQYGGAEDDPLQRKHLVNQKWLDQVLSQNQKPFTLVYGHEAAFMAGRHNDDDTLAANASARNSFVQSMLNAKALYFCGHDHFYDRMSVVRFSSPSAAKFFQVTAGTAGAPFYPAGQYAGSALWKQERVAHIDNVYGYILVVVDEKQATITFKGALPYGCDKGDKFTFTAMDQMVCDGSGCKTVDVNP